MRTAERVARNASYSLANGVVGFLAGIVSSVALARILGPRDLGTYALVLSTAGLVGMAVSLGVPHAATKYVAEYEGRADRETAGAVLLMLARLQIALGVAGATAVVVSAPWLERAFQAPEFAVAFRIAAIGLLAGAVGSIAWTGLQGFQDYRRVALLSMASAAFFLATTIGLLAAGAGAPGAVASLGATGVLGSVLAWRGLRCHVRLRVRRASVPLAARRKLRRYVPAVSGVLLLDAVVWQRSEVFFLGIFRSPREVAWYALAFGVATTVVRLVPRALSTVLAPLASGLYGAEDRVGMRILFRTGSRYLMILAAPIVVGGSVLASPLLTEVYGSEYGPAAVAFPLLLVGAGFGAVGSVTAGIQHGMERQDLVLKVAVAATVANLSLDIGLIPIWGVLGAAIANMVAQTGAVVAGVVLTSRLLREPFPVLDCARAFGAAGLTGGIAFAVATGLEGAVGVATGIVAGAAVYPVALVLVKAIRGEDLERLRSAGVALPGRLRPRYERLLRVAARCT